MAGEAGASSSDEGGWDGDSDTKSIIISIKVSSTGDGLHIFKDSFREIRSKSYLSEPCHQWIICISCYNLLSWIMFDRKWRLLLRQSPLHWLIDDE